VFGTFSSGPFAMIAPGYGSWLSQDAWVGHSDKCADRFGHETPKSPGSTASGSDASTLSFVSSMNQAPAQTSRAAKRQRARERRKLFKALSRLEQKNDHVTLTAEFEQRVAEVSADLRLVIQNTFIDVVEVNNVSESMLPSCLFRASADLERCRRDYRKRRLSWKGAQSEFKRGLLCAEHDTPWLVL